MEDNQKELDKLKIEEETLATVFLIFIWLTSLVLTKYKWREFNHYMFYLFSECYFVCKFCSIYLYSNNNLKFSKQIIV